MITDAEKAEARAVLCAAISSVVTADLIDRAIERVAAAAGIMPAELVTRYVQNMRAEA